MQHRHTGHIRVSLYAKHATRPKIVVIMSSRSGQISHEHTIVLLTTATTDTNPSRHRKHKTSRERPNKDILHSRKITET